MRCTTVLALLFGVVLYLGMGALVFQNLEAYEENRKFNELLTAKDNFLKYHSCVSEQEFYKLLKDVASSVEAGLELDSLSHNFTTRWDVASAFFFCGAIITTIGFGNLSPRTWYGQLFCVCYALVGIPMFGILLAGVGDHMGTVLRKAVAKIEALFLKRQVRPTTVRVISAVLSILIGCLIFLAVPTVVFQKSEDWSFLESLYFVVITLTTVGFGDYVPDGSHAGGLFFKPLVWLWIVFGLAYFASILTMIGNWLRVLSKRTRAEMEELRAHATDWTQHMSKDFRIPNPLEFNDPFLLQRRRWKRSGRRRIRRGAQVTLGYWARGGSENGHIPGRWVGLSGSAGYLEGLASTSRRSTAFDLMGRLGGGGTMPKAKPAAAAAMATRRSLPHLLMRSFSLPAAPSSAEAGSAIAGEPEDSLSGTDFDSGSEVSSESSSFSLFRKLRVQRAVNGVGEMNPEEEEDGRVGTDSRSSPATPPYSTGLLDFFGENLAYIDESSDALSERADESKRGPRKPKRKSMRREHDGEMQPPSNPPTPPPGSSFLSETNTNSLPTL
ncbi:potassium channel subfamily K member 2 [Stigmatopora nigra]